MVMIMVSSFVAFRELNLEVSLTKTVPLSLVPSCVDTRMLKMQVTAHVTLLVLQQQQIGLIAWEHFKLTLTEC